MGFGVCYHIFRISSEEVIKGREVSNTWSEEQREAAQRILEEEKLDMSELQYAQEYLGKFIDDLRQFFSDELIAACCNTKRPDIIHRERFHFLGVDIARLGDDEGTYEVIDRVDKDNLVHVFSEIQRKKLTTYTHDRIIQLNKQYNFKEIGIDAGAGSLGVGVLDFLLREPYIKTKVVALNNRRVIYEHSTQKTTRLLKEHMYYHLLALMEKGFIKLLNEDEVFASLKSVQYEYIRKEGMQTKLRIFGNYTHIVEGIVRAAWLANQKHLRLFIDYI